MSIRGIADRLFSGHRVILMVILCLFGLCVMQSAGQKGKRSRQQKAKVEDKRVYLIHADQLRFDQFSAHPDAQILNGSVHFRHKGASLYCDSAYFYEASNSFEAFGHVKMYQGDTLSLFSDYAYYDGNEEIARARYNVVMKHRKTTLYTDSLDYDRMYHFGYFFEGGKMIDQGSVLTSDWGEYNTQQKQAIFYYDVKLNNKKFRLTTDSLYYDTKTSWSHAVGPSRIYSGDSRIYSEDGYYNTKTDKAQLYGRSILNDKGRTLVGDSVFYSQEGDSEAFGNVVYNDSTNKNMLKGEYCFYNEKTGYAMMTDRAVSIDYSQGDSLFMHADTLKVFTFYINTDSVYRKVHAYHKVRSYRTDVQAVCDSLVYNTKDSCMVMYRDPIVWYNNQQVFGERIEAYMKDSVMDRAYVIGQAFVAQQMPDSIHFNQLSSKELHTFFRKGKVREIQAIDHVLTIYYPVDEADSSLVGMNNMETTLLKIFMNDGHLERIWAPSSEGTMYPMTQLPPDKVFLPGYQWFDYIRPLSKEDIFVWRPKKEGTELKKQPERREAPLRRLSSKSGVEEIKKEVKDE